ncbi:MAG TPA: peptidylprolyl isomerase [Candidatus Avirikenella pullistercoris]|nr:peptidylprolyl isomerase [Candidatus Avirikenella pullistercoris]
MIINCKKFLVLFLIFSIGGIGVVRAQEEQPQRERYIADEIVAVVGNSMILLSELKVAEAYLAEEYQARGYTGANPEGEALEALLMQKLLASQAAIDSITVNQSTINAETERRIQQFIADRGSAKAVEEYFHKPIFSVRDQIRRSIQEQQMALNMRQSIQEDVTMTPSDVAKYVKQIDKDSMPVVPEQYVYAQIVKYPPQTDEARLNVKEQLLDLRNRILNGANFAALARMYSEDVGSAIRGGEMDPQPKESFVAPFAEALSALKPGQVSEIVETEFGFHIIELIDNDNGLYHCRHILMKVKFDGEQKAQAVAQLDSLVKEINEGNITFEEAAVKYSDDEESALNEGIVVNKTMEMYGPRMKSNRFYREALGPDYEYIKNLKVGDISKVFESYDNKLDESVKVIKLVEYIPAHSANLKEDYSLLEEYTLGQKKEEVFQEWLNKKIAEMFVRIEEPYRSTIKLENTNWLK